METGFCPLACPSFQNKASFQFSPENLISPPAGIPFIQCRSCALLGHAQRLLFVPLKEAERPRLVTPGRGYSVLPGLRQRTPGLSTRHERLVLGCARGRGHVLGCCLSTKSEGESITPSAALPSSPHPSFSRSECSRLRPDRALPARCPVKWPSSSPLGLRAILFQVRRCASSRAPWPRASARRPACGARWAEAGSVVTVSALGYEQANRPEVVVLGVRAASGGRRCPTTTLKSSDRALPGDICSEAPPPAEHRAGNPGHACSSHTHSQRAPGACLFG